MAEEYVDAGLWKSAGFRFRGTKALERIMLKGCQALVVLTDPAREHLCRDCSIDSQKIFVIPCCADLAQYSPKEDMGSSPSGRPLRVVYSGSTVERYDLPAMLSFFSILLEKRPGSRFTILSTGNLDRDRAIVTQFRLPPGSVSLLSVQNREVPCHLAAQDLGLVMLKGNLALRVGSPNKRSLSRQASGIKTHRRNLLGSQIHLPDKMFLLVISQPRECQVHEVSALNLPFGSRP
jgi:hypothetical protein